MKMRIFALLLVLLLLAGAMPMAAAAGEESGEVSGHWSKEKFLRNSRFTYPFEFEETLVSCTGFTLDYEIVEVTQGDADGHYVFEVYVCDTRGQWKSVTSFYLEDQKISLDVTFKNPISVKAVAVICQKKATFSYSHKLAVRNPVCRSSSQNENVVTGSWGQEQFRLDNRAVIPYLLDQPLKNCTGFSLIYEVLEISEGSLNGTFPYAVYVRSTDGTWQRVQQFQMDGYVTGTDITFPAMDVDAVAVFCMKNADLTYTFTMTVTDPITE